MYVEWAPLAFVAVVLILALGPSVRAISRNRRWLGAVYALVGPIVVIGLPLVVAKLWEAAHPDEEWSMSAPEWLTLSVSPITTVPLLLFGSWAVNAVAGWNVRQPASGRRQNG